MRASFPVSFRPIPAPGVRCHLGEPREGQEGRDPVPEATLREQAAGDVHPREGGYSRYREDRDANPQVQLEHEGE